MCTDGDNILQFCTKRGTWRAQVRWKGKYASRPFRLKTLASESLSETERSSTWVANRDPKKVGRAKTISDLIDLHIEDFLEIGKPIRRSKRVVLEALKRELGAARTSNLDRSSIIIFGKKRAKQGAGLVTLSVDLSHLHTVFTLTAAVHGIDVNI